jgi:hypothetical protein
MELTAHVNRLGREFATLAEAVDGETREVVERLSGSLESAIRMTLLEALSAAADEITRELAPGSAELCLRGRDPYFVVTAPPTGPLGGHPTTVHTAPPTEDGPSARINVRLPEQLKVAVEEAAAEEGRSVNAWLVRAATSALHRADHDPHCDASNTGTRTRQSFAGWVH